MPSGTHYEILQVQPTADFEIIQAASRRMMLRYHPDRNDSADAPEMTRRLNQAYEVLSDPGKRTAYDKEITGERQTSRGSRGSAAGSQSSTGTESSVRLKNFLPSRAWLTGIVAAFAIATFMFFVGPNLTGNPLSWLFGGEDVLTALRGEIPNSATAESNGGVDASQTVVSVAAIRGALLTPDPTTIPTAIPKPSLTERDIFELDAGGELAPEVTAVLLRLMQRGLYASLDLPGLITATGINPL